MSLTRKLRVIAIFASLAGTQLRENKGEIPPLDTIHGRNYQSLTAAHTAFNNGDRAAASAHLAEVPDWDWVDAKLRVALHGRALNIFPGQFRSVLTNLVLDGDLADADMLRLPALAVLADYFKTN